MEFIHGTETLVFNSKDSKRVYGLNIKTHSLQLLQELPATPKHIVQTRDWLLMTYQNLGEHHVTIRNLKTGKNGLSKSYASDIRSVDNIANSSLEGEMCMAPDGKYFMSAREFNDGVLYVPFDRFTGMKIYNTDKYFFKHREYTPREIGESPLPYLMRDNSIHAAFNPSTGAVVLRTNFKEITVFENLDNMKALVKLNMAKKLPGDYNILQGFCFSGDGSVMVGVSHEGTVFVWDAKNNYKLLREFKVESINPQAIILDKTGRRLFSQWEDIGVWDVENGKMIGQINEDEDIRCMALSGNGDLLAYAVGNAIKMAAVPDLFTLQTITVSNDAARTTTANFTKLSKNGKYLYVGVTKEIRVYNLSTLRLETSFYNDQLAGRLETNKAARPGTGVYCTEFDLLSDESGRYLLLGLRRLIDLDNPTRELPFEWTSTDKKVTALSPGVYRLALKSAQFNTPVFYGRVLTHDVPPPVLVESDYIKSNSRDWWKTQVGKDVKGNTYRMDERNGQLLVNGTALPSKFDVSEALFGLNVVYTPTADGKQVWIISGSTVELWETATSRRVLSLFQTQGGYVFQLEDGGYYSGTPGVMERMAFERDGRLLPADQFDYFFNRPDLILEKLGFTETNSTVGLYRKALQKRLKKAGIDKPDPALMASGPQVKLRNEAGIPFVSTSDALSVELDVADANVTLRSLQVWVNNIPVFGLAGKAISGNTHADKLSIGLRAGENIVEISATNSRGIESERIALYVLNRKNPGKGNLFLVGAGCSAYKDANFRLDYAAKDARDLGAFYKNDRNAFDSVLVFHLLDAEFTRANLPKISQWLAQSRPEDMVMLFYAGHGVLDENLDYYLAPVDMDFAAPAARGIPFETFESLLNDVPAQRRVLLVDACHSGEIDKAEWSPDTTVTGGANVKIRGFVKGKKGGAKGSTYQLMQDLFPNYGKGNGAFVLTAAGGAEFSWEQGDLRNGIFTYSLIEGLRTKFADADKNARIDLSEWARYTERRVKELSNNRQNPTIRNRNIYLNPVVWNYRSASTAGSTLLNTYTIQYDRYTSYRCFESAAGHWMADDMPAVSGHDAVKKQTAEKARGICPEGWHVPTREEWLALDLTCEQDNTCELVNAFQSEGKPYWTSSREDGLPLMRTGTKQFEVANPEDSALLKCKKD